MRIHADLAQPAIVHSAALAWTDSPEPGVRRKMLERDGGEVARATSVVRFEPGCRFPEHDHGLGEEFLVLEGLFADEHGEYPAATYVRHPPGSEHSPFSPTGCTLFVKLRQMDPSESRTVVVDTRAAAWHASPDPGVKRLPLFADGREQVELVRLAPGATLLPAAQAGGLELFVLEGGLDARLEDPQGRGERLLVGSWLRIPPGAGPALLSPSGCTFYRKNGHLGACPRSGPRPIDR